MSAEAKVPATDGKAVAYILLWFPLASETFIFREVERLRAAGLDTRVYTMYGSKTRGISEPMAAYDGPVSRMGAGAFLSVLGAFFRAMRSKPRKVLGLMRRGLFRRMRNAEALAENSWCFFAGFLLAERCAADGTGLIHAAWANGPATAAWVASQLSGIPFAFTGRAGDIYPEDGILAEKATDAIFIRTNNAANVAWLGGFCPGHCSNKVRLVYNGLTFSATAQPLSRKPQPPYRLLAVGRFARTKGFPELFAALARLRRERFPVRLTLVGDGAWRSKLLALRKRLHLEDCVDMNGFVPNDQLAEYMRGHDLLVVPSVVYANGDRDGIPNVIMEASSLELPVVATDVCGIPEVIRNEETGRLVPQRDPAALANAIREMLENPEKARTRAMKARALVESMFDPQKNCAALLSLYQDALGGSRENA